MTEKILNKRSVISLGFFALFFHIVTMELTYFINTSVFMIVDYVIIGLTAAITLLFIAQRQIPIRFQPAQILLVLFMFWFIISCISMGVTYDNDWVNHNAFPMLNTAISMFLSFPLGYVWIREKNETVRPDTGLPQEGRVSVPTMMMHILLLGSTVFIGILLLNLFQGNEVIMPNGGLIRMGLGLELCCHYNITGAWELVFFLGCCFMTIHCKPVPMKIIYILATVIHYTALVLSNSRTSILTTLFGFMAMTGIMTYLRLVGQGDLTPVSQARKWRKIIWAIGAAVIAGVVFYFASGLVFKLYNVLTNSNASARATAAEVASNPSFTGRTAIWKATIEGIFTSFRMAMFGVTPMSAADMINQMMNVNGVYAHAHNQFLQIAASNGIPALCIFLIWLFIMGKDMYKLYFVQKDKTPFLLIPVIILVLLLSNMLEAFLVYGYEINGFAFFLLCGILHGKVNEPIEANNPGPILQKLRRILPAKG